MTQHTYTVSGMTFGHCVASIVASITEEINSIDGVSDVALAPYRRSHRLRQEAGRRSGRRGRRRGGRLPASQLGPQRTRM